MQKTVKDNIIFVDKPKTSLIPLALSAASLLFIVLGAASLFYLQKPLQQVQQTQSDASVSDGQVVLTSTLTSSTNYTQGVPTTIDLQYNSQGVQLSGIQIVTQVNADAEVPTIEIPAASNLQAIFQEVEQVGDHYLVSVIVTHRTLGQTFSSNSPTTFARLTVPLRSPGQISLSYDTSNSFATVANTSPPEDQLRTPVNASFTISAVSPSPSASPAVSPSPSVTPSPAVTPTPGVTPTPAASPTPDTSPAPSVIPAGDDLYPRSDRLTVTFLTNDSARRTVPTAELRPYQTYRARIQYTVQNTRKNNVTNLTPVTTAFVINGQSNSYITNSIAYLLISNNADGGGNTVETVFSTLPDNSLRITVDAPNAYAETNEGNNILVYTFDADAGTGGTTTTTGLNRTCNQYCADSRECSAGFTCFYNRCRRPDNPDSTTCAAPTVTVTNAVIKSCNVACSSNKGCATNLRCYQGACRLATNPSSLTCSAATAGVITKGSTPTNGGTKGQETATPKPSTTPAASSSPKASVQPGATPTTETGTVTPSASPELIDERNEDAGSTSLFTQILTYFQDRGISLPLLAVGLGVLLFLFALLFAILGRRRNEPPKVVSVGKIPPKTPAEDELQRKINALKNNASVASGPTGAVKPPRPPVAVQNNPQQVSSTVIKPGSASSSTGKETPAADMMSRLRDRGVLDKKPGSDSAA